MTRVEKLDEIIKNNTLTHGYSKFDENLYSSVKNTFENLHNNNSKGITFVYKFYINLYNNDLKSQFESKISNQVFNTPSNFDQNIDKLVYHTYNLPVNYYQKKNSNTWEIHYKLNYSTKYFSKLSCKEDPSNCEELFACHAIDKNNKVVIKHVTHHDIYHLLVFVSKYPQSNTFLDSQKKITIKSSNQNNAYQIMQDYCYFMAKRLGVDESQENNLKVTKQNNFCGFNFDGTTPDILLYANNYDGETVNHDGVNKLINPSDSYENYEKFSNYQNVSEFSTQPLQSFPEAKYTYLNYCRGSNFNDKKCKDFYFSMFRKADFDGGNLDEDVQEHLLLMCKTKDQYVPDHLNYYSKISGDFVANDIDKLPDMTKDECQLECDKLDNCEGFVMELPNVEFFSDPNFSNLLGSLPEGKYDAFEMQENGIENDSVLSIKIPEGYIVICYEDGYFSGNSIVLSGNNILADFNFHNTLSSVEISQFDCEAYKQKNPDIAQIYDGNCNLLKNHFKEYGIREGRDASSFFKGKGCWLKKSMSQNIKKNDRISFKKQDTDDVCSCFYRSDYYKDYLKKNNYPKEAEREKPKCWFPKCYAGINAIKADPNSQCSDLVICNNQIQNILKAGGDINNVDIDIIQNSQCQKLDGEQNNEKDSQSPAESSESEESSMDSNQDTGGLSRFEIIMIILGSILILSILIFGGIFLTRNKNKQNIQKTNSLEKQFKK